MVLRELTRRPFTTADTAIISLSLSLSLFFFSHITPGGTGGGGPVYIIPAGAMPTMVQQPFFIINPSATTGTAGDLSSVQQLQQANLLAANANSSLAGVVSNPAGGYLLVSPGPGAANFTMPLVNLASTASVSSSQPAIPSKF